MMSSAEKLKFIMDAYAVGVRAGVLTPCLEDENKFRELLGLPTAPESVKADWAASAGVRRPITLSKPADTTGQEKPAQTVVNNEDKTNEEV